MKITLTAKLILIMILSILFSSLISISLVGSFTVRQVKDFSNQRDRDTALTVAEALSRAADEGELDKAIRSMGNSKGSVPRGMMSGRMMSNRVNSRSEEQPDPRWENPLFPPGLMVKGSDTVIPLIITDSTGRILQAPVDLKEKYLRNLRIDEGAPYYQGDQIAGYVLAGNFTGTGYEEGELHYVHSIYKGVLLYPSLAALLASVLGAFMLNRTLKPLKSLYKGVLNLREGDFSYRVPMPRRNTFFTKTDELIRLSEGFNDMAGSLEDSEKWKRRIIIDTAHELRTPVSLIMGNLEMILDGVYKPDRNRMESLYRESVHLAEMIKGLQTLASEEAGQTTTECKEFSLSELLGQVQIDFQGLARKSEISITLDTQEALLFQGDSGKTRQVLKNLMSNALKFTPAGGEIILRAYNTGGKIFVEVEDSGPGVPQEQRERIFDRFYKLDESRNSGGYGLGLAISRALVENQGGRIVALQAELGGALMRIEFPENPEHKA